MSTKGTIFYHDTDFHFYHEALDDGYVYLNMPDRDSVTIDHSGVTVRIPVEVMEIIKHVPPFDLSYARYTDEDLLSEVTQEVTSRIEDYNKDPDDIWGLVAGSATFGLPGEPKEEQIKRGMVYYTRMRDTQKSQLERFLEYCQINGINPSE